MLDTLWLLLCSGLVFLMQAGFMCLESGMTRSKNSINVAIKNLADFGISGLLFWGFGFALMFGASRWGLWGQGELFPALSQPPKLAVFFLFQVMFCGTATTIISGVAAERLKFGAYLLIASLVSGLIYPVFGHWVWNQQGEFAGLSAGGGWLERLGFRDFAGGTAVHSLGAWVGLAVVNLIGARRGRFESTNRLQGSNMPFSVLGAFLLWFGWIGFNGGSSFTLDDQTPGIILNTVMAGVGGMIGALVLGWAQEKVVRVETLINGSLAGLVAITPGANGATTPLAVIIGLTGAAVALLCAQSLQYRRIDDAVDGVAVHGAAGSWGTLCVALFGELSVLDTGLNRWQQILVQLLGILVCGLWAYGATWLALTALGKVYPLRISPEEEELGLNISEHQAKTETYDLFEVMDHQAKTHDLSLRAPVEPFTEVGHIAARYNQVLSAFEARHHQSVEDLAQIYYVTAAILAAIEHNNFKADQLGLEEIATRPNEFGALAGAILKMAQIIQEQERQLERYQDFANKP